jgi:hypothetical protein
MGYDGESGFGYHFHHRQPQGNVHRDGQKILGHQDFYVKLFDEPVKFVF